MSSFKRKGGADDGASDLAKRHQNKLNQRELLDIQNDYDRLQDDYESLHDEYNHLQADYNRHTTGFLCKINKMKEEAKETDAKCTEGVKLLKEAKVLLVEAHTKNEQGRQQNSNLMNAVALLQGSLTIEQEKSAITEAELKLKEKELEISFDERDDITIELQSSREELEKSQTKLAESEKIRDDLVTRLEDRNFLCLSCNQKPKTYIYDKCYHFTVCDTCVHRIKPQCIWCRAEGGTYRKIPGLDDMVFRPQPKSNTNSKRQKSKK